MFLKYSLVKKGILKSLLLVLLFCLPLTSYAQLKECASLYKTYRDNRIKDPTLAYESAKEFLRRCPNNDRNVKKWTDAYEREAYKTEPAPDAPVQSSASSSATRMEQTEAQVLKIVTPGRYYALVIGNDSYHHLKRLKTAVADARVIESILREQYGFDAKLLLNASRQDVFQAISYYRQNIDATDNLLIYYAGHGYFDREADKAYWLPVDARREDSANWISADDITSNIRAVTAKHVLIVSDSCYSGTIYRGLGLAAPAAPVERDRFLQKMLGGKSRTLMASGGNEPVADDGGGGHSVFARVFITGLTQMEKSIYTASELFRDFIQERVAGGANQTPEYNPLRNSGHESGDFVFVRRKAPNIK